MCLKLIIITPFYNVSIVNFEQVSGSWVTSFSVFCSNHYIKLNTRLKWFKNFKKVDFLKIFVCLAFVFVGFFHLFYCLFFMCVFFLFANLFLCLNVCFSFVCSTLKILLIKMFELVQNKVKHSLPIHRVFGLQCFAFLFFVLK